MMERIKEYYRQDTAIRAKYNDAKERNDAAGIAAAREENNQWKIRLDAEGDQFGQIYSMYADSMRKGNELIDVSGVIWDEKVPALVETFRAMGIERFTFSSTWSSAVETAWLFIQNGCTLDGMVQINGMMDLLGEEHERRPAYLFSVN